MCAPATPGVRAGVVLSFGVNDTVHEAGVPRVAAGASIANLQNPLEQLHTMDWAAPIAGPPGVSDAEHNRRIVALDTGLAVECAHPGAGDMKP